MTDKLFITAEEIAGLLCLPSAASFLNRRARLEEEDLFPLPMPHSRRPLLWKADEVYAWIEVRGMPALPGPAPIDPALIASGKVSLLQLARA
jgi:hypothetical protein